MLVIPIKLTHPEGRMPVFGNDDAVGADIHSTIRWTLNPMERKLFSAGFAMQLPANFEAQIRPRSGLALKHGVTVLNAPGTIDPDYRGDVGAILINLSDKPFEINVGDRIAQMVVKPIWNVEFTAWSTLSETARGAAGFGSTGLQ